MRQIHRMHAAGGRWQERSQTARAKGLLRERSERKSSSCRTHDTQAEQIKPGTPISGPLDQLQAGHLSFGLPITPGNFS
jgi:hypothetical protein